MLLLIRGIVFRGEDPVPNSDVWVFGTRHGYQHLLRLINRRAAVAHSAAVIAAPPDRPGVDLRLLPTFRRPAHPFIVAQERLRPTPEGPRLEVALGGCADGFRLLAHRVRQICRDPSGPSEHLHLDWRDPLLHQCTVSLNFRAPVDSFSEQGLGEYWHMCSQPPRDFPIPLPPPSMQPEFAYTDFHVGLPSRDADETG